VSDTRDLVEQRLERAVRIINDRRRAVHKPPVRIDIDIAPRGIMAPEDWYYRFRSELRFAPLMTLRVGYKQNVFYFDVEGTKPDSDVYKVIKNPPRAEKKLNYGGGTYWLANELDTPLEAIEQHMTEVLA
jgi:hypothetical protein